MANFIFCDDKFINVDLVTLIEVFVDQSIRIHMADVDTPHIRFLPEKANEFLNKLTKGAHNMAGEMRMKQFVNEEVKPVIRKTIPSMLDRLVALEKAVEELSKPKTMAPETTSHLTHDPKPKETTLSDVIGGKEGVAAIKSSKTLVEAISKVKKVKAKKSKK